MMNGDAAGSTTFQMICPPESPKVQTGSGS
jgi:hypothetical protein